MTDLLKGELAYDEPDIIRECQERFRLAVESFDRNRNEFEFDKRFLDGDQWDPTIRDERFSDRRPCLTVNITEAVCRRVMNMCRENRPRMVTHAVGSGADVDTAKVIDGMFRHIEYASNAAFAYDTAVENSVGGGWGWLSVDGEYISEHSMDQDLRIRAWVNPLMIYHDPNSRAPDGSDMEWLIETEFISRTDYRQRYGVLDPQGWMYVGGGDDIGDWSSKEKIRVAKYWRIERHMDTLVQLSNGKCYFEDEMPSEEAMSVLGLTVTSERELLRRKIVCRLLTQNKILHTAEWPGRWIPFVIVYGRRFDVNGKISVKGLVRELRDPARIYNYAQTAKTEQYALQPKAPWVGAAGFMDGKENQWRDTNRKPLVALEYNPVRLEDGSYAPPPERQPPAQPATGFMEWGESTKSDFLALAGMPHDPGQDKQGEVISGIALRRRTGISDLANLDFYDNFTRSLNQLGRVLLDLIPHYYDTPRMMRIIREDGTHEVVGINQMDEATKTVKNNVCVGEYDVVIDTGPAYQTKREQSAEAMLELLGTPAGQMVAQTAADLMVRAMDFPNSDMVADRLVTMIPAAQMDKNSKFPPEAQAIIQGLRAQLQQARQAHMAAQLEIESKHGLEQMRQQGETQRTLIKVHAEREDAHLRAATATHDAHVKAVTAHDVAEINNAGRILDTHANAAHQRELVRETAAQAKSAEKRET